MTTKILALTDAIGVRLVLLAGHRFDTVSAAPLIDGFAFVGFIADKALDSNSIIADLKRARRQNRHFTAPTERFAAANRRKIYK